MKWNWLNLSFKKEKEKKFQIHFLPGSFFFTKSIVCPQKLKQKEAEAFVSASIEGISPFPLEQLLWGFSIHEQNEGCEVLIYAALKERLNCGHEVILEAGYVLPSFAIGYFLAIPGITVFAYQNELSLFEYSNAGKRLIETNKISETESTESVYQRVLTKYNIEASKVHFIELKAVELDHRSLTVNYTLSNGTGNALQSEKAQHFPLAWLWNADVRDKDFLKKEKKSRHIEQLFQQGMRGAAYGVLFILCLEALLLMGKFRLWINTYAKNRLQPKATAVESKDFLVEKIKHTVEQEIRPFELLGILNRYRPDSVYFSSATADNLHNVSIEGIAEAANNVETYRKALQESNYFESLSVGNIVTDNKGAKFTLLCDFKEHKKSQLAQLERN